MEAKPVTQAPPLDTTEGEAADETHAVAALNAAVAAAKNAAAGSAADAPSSTKDDQPEPSAAPSGSGAETAPDAATPAEVAPFEHGIGVLLVNLGTPEAPERKAVRRYLKEFLSDRRVIENDSLVWKLVLHGIILPLRSRWRARDYRRIWNHENNESPFKTITRAQAEKLAGTLAPLGQHVMVDWAMRYAGPSIGSRLETLIKRGCDRILVMPLYPQYAAATTATVGDEVCTFMLRQRRQPALRILPAYYEDPYYIEALTSSLRAELKALPFAPDVIMASYHGMPKEYVAKGDPYQAQCERTTQLLREQFGFDDKKLIMTYQSRFGRSKWLEPYTIRTVKALAKQGVKNLVVVTPGFAADCLETLEEIAVENAHVFKRYGGKNFAALPCLNDSEAGMLMLRQLATRELRGWV